MTGPGIPEVHASMESMNMDENVSVKSEPLIKRLAQFADHAFQASFEGCDLEGSEIQDMGVARGLLIQSEFDPKRHTNSTGELEAGDSWYEYSPELKAALSTAPVSPPSSVVSDRLLAALIRLHGTVADHTDFYTEANKPVWAAMQNAAVEISYAQSATPSSVGEEVLDLTNVDADSGYHNWLEANRVAHTPEREEAFRAAWRILSDFIVGPEQKAVDWYVVSEAVHDCMNEYDGRVGEKGLERSFATCGLLVLHRKAKPLAPDPRSLLQEDAKR